MWAIGDSVTVSDMCQQRRYPVVFPVVVSCVLVLGAFRPGLLGSWAVGPRDYPCRSSTVYVQYSHLPYERDMNFHCISFSCSIFNPQSRVGLPGQTNKRIMRSQKCLISDHTIKVQACPALGPVYQCEARGVDGMVPACYHSWDGSGAEPGLSPFQVTLNQSQWFSVFLWYFLL